MKFHYNYYIIDEHYYSGFVLQMCIGFTALNLWAAFGAGPFNILSCVNIFGAGVVTGYAIFTLIHRRRNPNKEFKITDEVRDKVGILVKKAHDNPKEYGWLTRANQFDEKGLKKVLGSGEVIAYTHRTLAYYFEEKLFDDEAYKTLVIITWEGYLPTVDKIKKTMGLFKFDPALEDCVVNKLTLNDHNIIGFEIVQKI